VDYFYWTQLHARDGQNHQQTSNLSKAHLTCNSGGPATWVIIDSIR